MNTKQNFSFFEFHKSFNTLKYYIQIFGALPLLIVTLPSTSFSEEYFAIGGSAFDIYVNNTQLDCKENFEEKFSRCSVSLDIIYNSDYNGRHDPEVFVRCYSRIIKTSSDGFESYETNDILDYFYGREAYGTMDIDFNFALFSDIVKVQIKEAECEITDVF